MLLGTSAWIEYFQGAKKGETVRDVLEEERVAYTVPPVVAELYSKYARSGQWDEAQRLVEVVLRSTAMIETTSEITLAAGRIHAEMKKKVPDFGMADAFILAAARSRGTHVLTKDSHFRGIPATDLL